MPLQSLTNQSLLSSIYALTLTDDNIIFLLLLILVFPEDIETGKILAILVLLKSK